ncbi:uncharacterized protein PGTG_02793 [Puccinia graminis f. sp. tritici CRL 75-36-700-3]|uniref:Uncharacterized protein n=1 Tax=Puccinia graminis f. sp. tritici (strain CRL 75-36-700-3 / race SCCL) TaxID=418459 RepID=E3JWC7_PUCGT|nr:uncharacterized protein PGTG_02793 [Puccinia graminis f. sp. tritici CRL 75-36-700-3]EFP76352.2 hypothetical protein PGTG_02793 [Puccinia graminis f. sp. tritici CRL 75-36-700-3]
MFMSGELTQPNITQPNDWDPPYLQLLPAFQVPTASSSASTSQKTEALSKDPLGSIHPLDGYPTYSLRPEHEALNLEVAAPKPRPDAHHQPRPSLTTDSLHPEHEALNLLVAAPKPRPDAHLFIFVNFLFDNHCL